MHIENLPSEILLKILSFLNSKDLVTVSFISKFFYQLSQVESLWGALSDQRWFLPENLPNKKSNYSSLYRAELKERSQHLPLDILSCDAQDWDTHYGIKNLLKRGGHYCTKTGYFKNVNITFKLNSSTKTEVLVVREIELAAPISYFTAPVDTAIVFASYKKPRIEDTNEYVDLDEDGFRKLVEETPSSPQLQRKGRPIGFFSCQYKEMRIHRITFHPPVICRYLHLKLLSSFGAKNVNIDVKHFLVSGFIWDIMSHVRTSHQSKFEEDAPMDLDMFDLYGDWEGDEFDSDLDLSDLEEI